MVHDKIVGSLRDGQMGLWSNGLDICSPDWRAAVRSRQDQEFFAPYFLKVSIFFRYTNVGIGGAVGWVWILA